jgi:biopolymer transport protein ExbD
MTPLIDVIFLLLLFFMLSSTFTRFAEVDLSAAGAGQGGAERPVFVQLAPDRVSMNGQAATLSSMPDRLAEVARRDAPLLVALQGPVTAQRLTDLLAVLRSVSGLRVTVLGDR